MFTDINFKKLIKHVETNTKNGYEAAIHESKIVDNLANVGGRRGEIFKLNRPGEYNGLAIELLENVKPLLTNNLIIRILKMISTEDFNTPLNILGLVEIDELLYILKTWLQLALKTPSEYTKSFAPKKTYIKFNDWIKTYRFDPINAKFKIVEIGMNRDTGQSVVPSDWIDREFDSGRYAHREMDALESRIGKSPVTYAIIYSMQIVKNNSVITDITNIKYKLYVEFIFDGKKFITSYPKKPKENKSNSLTYILYTDTLIGFNLDNILKEKTSEKNNRDVGILVSRLQKCIRRGRYAMSVMENTIDELNNSANYNLPEHNFMRVSAAKQLVWRLFISIMEDCRPYYPINELSLLDLILLTLITNKLTEYKFAPKVLDLIKKTAINAQTNDTASDLFNWRDLEESDKIDFNLESDYHMSIALSVKYLPMMSSDKRMLSKLYSATEFFEPFSEPNKKYIKSEISTDTILSSYDHHCKTCIILYYQGCVNDMTTKETSNYIWNTSSSYNIRSGSKLEADSLLRSIQKYFHDGLDKNSRKKAIEIKHDKTIDSEINNYVKRKVFIMLFGQTYKYNSNEIVIAGSPTEPVRIKKNDQWIYSSDLNILNSFPTKIIDLTQITPPDGYTWIKNECEVRIINGKPYIDDSKVKFFDGSSMIKSAVPLIKSNIKSGQNMINDIFEGIEIEFDLVKRLRVEHVDKYYNWKIPETAERDLVYLTYTKIFNQISNLIMIGPVDRLGHKMANSINYEYEGRLWVIFNLLSYLYPDTIIPNGLTNFKINTRTLGYNDLVNKLRKFIFVKKNISGIVPSIKTNLWDHQNDSVNKILAGFKSGGHGFGDASDVGAGKTLTALSIACNLINLNKSDSNYGILVLLPSNQLIKTWCDEIKKHTENFNLIIQENNNKIDKIKKNTIIITTMARARDHPINHTWLLVIIDECLSVQNKNALQTESAWKQSLLSKYLVMMSATFFRARFDKLYYMLKMLQTNLPENKSYLNAILLESIVSQVSSIKRKWTTNFNNFSMNSETKILYDKIANSDLSDDTLYAKLQAFLTNNSIIQKIIINGIKSIIKNLPNNKCLIYAKSNDEATKWSAKLGIPIYPEKGTHCIVTYHNGAYGLNDLIIYDTIIMRPPAPDLLPQIKGRLDRPGNKSDNLRIEYFIIKNTIDEGLIIRLNIASQFIQKYIMPLAKFYKISLNADEYK